MHFLVYQLVLNMDQMSLVLLYSLLELVSFCQHSVHFISMILVTSLNLRMLLRILLISFYVRQDLFVIFFTFSRSSLFTFLTFIPTIQCIRHSLDWIMITICQPILLILNSFSADCFLSSNHLDLLVSSSCPLKFIQVSDTLLLKFCIRFLTR